VKTSAKEEFTAKSAKIAKNLPIRFLFVILALSAVKNVHEAGPDFTGRSPARRTS
jgi:hypothetical protein